VHPAHARHGHCNHPHPPSCQRRQSQSAGNQNLEGLKLSNFESDVLKNSRLGGWLPGTARTRTDRTSIRGLLLVLSTTAVNVQLFHCCGQQGRQEEVATHNAFLSCCILGRRKTVTVGNVEGDACQRWRGIHICTPPPCSAPRCDLVRDIRTRAHVLVELQVVA
jgi:hypothetical protein